MWYSASLFYRADHLSQGKDPLWLESICLFQAPSEQVAREAAERYGRSEEHSYEVSKGDVVTWRFVRVERIYTVELDGLDAGGEVFSRFLRDAEAKSLLAPLEP